jgi:phosphoribosyl 1,2-cyclic phosphodiesterase
LPSAVSIALVIDPAKMGLREIRCPLTTFAAPANYLDAVEKGAVFIRDEPDGVEPYPPEEMHVPDSGELADIAARAGVDRLVLTHISSRYAGDAGVLADEARAVFDGAVTVARDGLELDVPFPESD